MNTKNAPVTFTLPMPFYLLGFDFIVVVLLRLIAQRNESKLEKLVEAVLTTVEAEDRGDELSLKY